jgi:hypothetical protein
MEDGTYEKVRVGTTTSIIQSSPVPLRPPPLPEDAFLE